MTTASHDDSALSYAVSPGAHATMMRQVAQLLTSSRQRISASTDAIIRTSRVLTGHDGQDAPVGVALVFDEDGLVRRMSCRRCPAEAPFDQTLPYVNQTAAFATGHHCPARP